MTSVTISIDKLRMFAHHGIHAEERLAGAEFEVDLQAEYPANEMINALDQTIDYTRVLDIVKEEMLIPRPLLETVGMSIAERVKDEFKTVQRINITIRKINPPVVNFRGQLSVSIQKTYEP
jgi:dihydroneopterin aldolase